MSASSHNVKDYEITVMSGNLTGSVRISGEVPAVLSNEQAKEFIEAIDAVRSARVGHKTMVTFVLTQPRDCTW